MYSGLIRKWIAAFTTFGKCITAPLPPTPPEDATVTRSSTTIRHIKLARFQYSHNSRSFGRGRPANPNGARFALYYIHSTSIPSWDLYRPTASQSPASRGNRPHAHVNRWTGMLQRIAPCGRFYPEIPAAQTLTVQYFTWLYAFEIC